MIRTQRLDLRPHLTQSLTAQQHQTIKLLQFSRPELAAYIRDASEQNPFLVDGNETSEETKERVSQSVFYGGSSAGRGSGESISSLEQSTAPLSLCDLIRQQIAVDLRDDEDRILAAHLLDALDDAGYLTTGIDEIASRIGCPAARLEKTLRRLQQFEPAGIFARDLKECLTLQLIDRNRLDPLIIKLLDRLDLVAAGKIAALQRICGVDYEEIRAMIAELRTLNPKPGHAFLCDATQQVTPDLILQPAKDVDTNGDWSVILSNEALPGVKIDRSAYSHLHQSVRQVSDRKYLEGRWQEALWLMRALAQRNQTLLKVGNAIVCWQTAFFTHGPGHLKPLGLRDIAKAIGVHESTVSRTTTNKYLLAPGGLYELKYFFSHKVTGAALHTEKALSSAKAIQHRIKVLIEREDVNDILSDDQIVAVLRIEGVDIARRTVAKYRDSLKIPPSSRRRQQKALSTALQG
ncbi:MAG: RNA polymerase factor sigma-54 [Alphaproteobacteria bacterium]